MIIACTSCPAQYSVPDAKVQGKKVRVTCKHCGTGIVVDGTTSGSVAMPFSLPAPISAPVPVSLPLPEPVPAQPRVLPPFDLPRAVSADDDQTRVMSRPSDFSVHEEPTVIGQIPHEALEAERRFSQRTDPPPVGPSDPPINVPPLTPVVPHAATLMGDPPAKANDTTSLASPQAMRSHAASLPQDSDFDAQQFRPRRWPWVLGAVALLTLLGVVAQVLR